MDKSPNEVIGRARSEGRGKLLEHEALSICEYYGIPVARYGIARSEEEAVEVARSVGLPVVLKVVSPDISHKTDVGGVILDIASEEGVRKGFRQVLESVRARAPKARLYGVLIQEMVKGGLEVIVGGTRDPTFGPVIMFGLGGVFVEVLKDVSFRVAPLTPEDAEDMVREVKGFKILEGYRGMPPRDINAIKDIILKTAKMMLELGDVQDIDLNPVMVFKAGEGAKVADARFILRG